MKTATIVINVLFALALLPSLGLLIPTMMMFDAPGSEKSPYTWLTAISLVCIPVFILIAQLSSWIAFARGNLQVAFWLSLMPLIPVCLSLLGFGLIAWLQGGKFTAG